MTPISCLIRLLLLCAALVRVSAAESPAGAAAPLEANSPAGQTITHVDAATAAKLVAANKVKILDIRTPEEYAEGHLRGATNINFSAPDFRQKLASLDRKQPYLLHCRSGNRSTKSLPVFEELGFRSVTHLDGGILAWTKAGQPVEKGAPSTRR